MACNLTVVCFVALATCTLCGCAADAQNGNSTAHGSAVVNGVASSYSPVVVLYVIPEDANVSEAEKWTGGVPQAVGTGVVIGPHHVLTAAHNLSLAQLHYPDDYTSKVAIALEPTAHLENGQFRYSFVPDSTYGIGYTMSKRSPVEAIRVAYLDDDLAILVTKPGREFAPERIATLASARRDRLDFGSRDYICGHSLVGYGAPRRTRGAAPVCLLNLDVQELVDAATWSDDELRLALQQRPLHYVTHASNRLKSEDRLAPLAANCIGDSGAPVLNAGGAVVGINKGVVPFVSDYGTAGRQCADAPEDVSLAGNLLDSENWGWVSSIKRLCTSEMTQQQCHVAISETTCGNLGAQEGFEQTDLRCYKRTNAITNPDGLDTLVGKYFESGSSGPVSDFEGWPADWALINGGRSSDCDLCVAHDG